MYKFKYQGKCKSLREMAEIFGITENSLSHRLCSGWKIKEDSLVAPFRKEHYMSNIPCSKYEARQLKCSFIGESVCTY